jgi:hypothetical protein
VWVKGYSTCFVSMKPCIQTPVPPKKEKNKEENGLTACLFILCTQCRCIGYFSQMLWQMSDIDNLNGRFIHLFIIFCFQSRFSSVSCAVFWFQNFEHEILQPSLKRRIFCFESQFCTNSSHSLCHYWFWTHGEAEHYSCRKISLRLLPHYRQEADTVRPGPMAW